MRKGTQVTAQEWLIGAILVVAMTVVSVGVGVFVNSADACEVNRSTSTWRPPFQQAYRQSSPFGYRNHPITHTRKLHAGIDLVSEPGPGPVVAASAGKVVRAGHYGGLGNTVQIQHNGGIATYYGHMARIDVRVGTRVAMGQRVGFEGSTGDSTGDHLHYEVRRNGSPVDPLTFMEQRHAALDGRPVGKSYTGTAFVLPSAGTPRQASLANKPLPVPAGIKRLYVNAANRYGLPWTLLAGIGMEETAHGKNKGTSSAGAKGLMQFMPATWRWMGVDGDGDGRADINNDADSAMSAANYLTRSGAKKNPQGVRDAIYSYNHAEWYINDVLYYAQSYGGGYVGKPPMGCKATKKAAGPKMPQIDNKRMATVVGWARSHVGDAFALGANGPNTWDASSYSRTAYAQIGVSLPRSSKDQRNYLAQGHGTRIQPGQERPGDLIFINSYRDPSTIGYVALVHDPKKKTTLEAKNPRTGVIYGSYKDFAKTQRIFEIWRPADPKPAVKPAAKPAPKVAPTASPSSTATATPKPSPTPETLPLPVPTEAPSSSATAKPSPTSKSTDAKPSPTSKPSPKPTPKSIPIPTPDGLPLPPAPTE
ncbi:M23 family metallopeptidase [Luteipulveratus mongoliensis]|uniref:M23 family metallopeptidase n=1 Tax=Luteipulveratus mongoliensis TaxID=571913 RepID=UPI0006985295|nr:M23 family metallopeptidase [Luteipulveratus mongoliensis]